MVIELAQHWLDRRSRPLARLSPSSSGLQPTPAGRGVLAEHLASRDGYLVVVHRSGVQDFLDGVVEQARVLPARCLPGIHVTPCREVPADVELAGTTAGPGSGPAAVDSRQLVDSECQSVKWASAVPSLASKPR